MSVAVVLGTGASRLAGVAEASTRVDTAWGMVDLYRAGRGWVLYRHGRQHFYLPHQIPYRAHMSALRKVGVETLVVTSSVGVMVDDVPLFEPLLVEDVVMLDNRLPDGSACTMWQQPEDGGGHLVLEEGLVRPPPPGAPCPSARWSSSTGTARGPRPGRRTGCWRGWGST